VSGARGSAVMRSSMNLNKNLRTEQFDIDVDDEVAAFYVAWFDALWEESGRTQDNRAIIQAVFDRYLANPEEAETRKDERQRPADVIRSTHAKKERAPSLRDVTFSLGDLSDLIV